MASLIDELIGVLTTENEEYRILLELSQKKTPVIVKGDVEKLQEITAVEQQHLDKIVKSEKKREEVVTDMATVLSLQKKDITIKSLIQVLAGQPDEQRRLSQAHDNLKNTLKEVAAVNDINTTLLNDSLSMVEFDLNLIRSRDQAPEIANYNSDSTYSQNIGNARQGLFDASQ